MQIKKWRKPLLVALLVISTIGASGGIALRTAFAATNQIYLTPSSASVQNGSNVTLALRVTPGAAINGVQATVNFDTTKLQYVSSDSTISAFTAQLQQTQSGSTMTIVRGDLSGTVASDALIENITFKALAGTGSSAVTLTGANATDVNSAYTNPTVGNSTISFTTPATGTTTVTPPPPATTSTGATSGTTSSGGTTKSSTSTSTTATPVVTSTPTNTTPPTVTSKNVQYNVASFTATSTVPTTAYVAFGLAQDALVNSPVSPLATTHALSIDSSMLTPGETYYYTVVATDAAGNVTKTEIQQFKTTGLNMRAILRDKNNKPLKNKTVVLHSTAYTVKTDSKGYATFSDITPGIHHVSYTDGKKSYSQEVLVANNIQTDSAGKQSAALQNVSVVLPVTQRGPLLTALWPVLLVVIVAAAAVYAYFNRQRFMDSFGHSTPLTSAAVIVGGATETSATTSEPVTVAPLTSTPHNITSTTPQSVNISEHLNTISAPSNPTPGVTIAPSTDNNGEEGKV